MSTPTHANQFKSIDFQTLYLQILDVLKRFEHNSLIGFVFKTLNLD